jgi:hypothetical protein
MGVCMVLGFGFCCVIGPIISTAGSGATQFASMSRSLDKTMERQQKIMGKAIEAEKIKQERLAKEAKMKEALLMKAAALAAEAAATVDWKKILAEGKDGAAERAEVLSYVKEQFGKDITDAEARIATDKAVDAAMAKAKEEKK